MVNKRYENLDGIRAFACIGIILMHVLANGGFGLGGFVFDRLIPSFTNLTYLFMLLSAFSLCCGYYDRFQNKTIDLETFYKRRYQRIWPFFALLCTVELIIDHNLQSLCEWFADLTLTFGLIPNNGIKVVGVGWFLGMVFVFYMLFPFFTFLMNNKKRAWIVMIITILLHLLCEIYFTETGGRSNIIFSAMFFVAGGLVFLYRDQLNRIRIPAFVFVIILLVINYCVYHSEFITLLLFASMAIMGVAMNNRFFQCVFQNKIIRFVSSISMEMYLCHMFVFRTLEKVHILHVLHNEIMDYVIVSALTIVGAAIMSFILKRLIHMVGEKTAKTS